MKHEFELAFNEIRNQRALSQDVVLEALKTALVSAYRRYANASSAQQVEASIDPVTGRTRIMVEKEVVSDVENPLTEVSLETARFYNPEAQLNDMVMVQVDGSAKQFGRIAAQTAKQVILQKIREAERNALFDEFVDREGDILTGTIQSVNGGVVTISLGRAEATMTRQHQIPNERYRAHDKLRVYLLEVKPSNKGPQIVVSRSHRNMLKRLLEFEVPEIYNGQVEIKSIAREAGYRSKVAVSALQEGIDPVGACVGMRGIRIQNIVQELHNEKIDVIEWQSDAKIFISKALSPARVTGVYLDEDPQAGRTAVVIVPEDQLSLAIGKEGQNARLAAKLTGWRIDIKSENEAVSTALDNIQRQPYVRLMQRDPELVEEVRRIVQKRDDGRAVMPEDYKLLSQFANASELVLIEAREEQRQARKAEIEAVKSTVPQELFAIPVTHLALAPIAVERLLEFENVGEIMWRFLLDESLISQKLRGLGADTFDKLKAALDDIMMAAMMGELAIPTEAPAPQAAEPTPEPATEVPAPATPEVFNEQVLDEVDATLTQEDENLPAAFPALDDEAAREEAAHNKANPKRLKVEPEESDDIIYDDDDEETRNKKKEKRKRRELVYDEEVGRVVSKRKRKGSRARDDWESFLE